MCLYTATICIDRGPQNNQDGRQVVVHWDDNDPNRAIGIIQYGHPITDERVLEVLLRDNGWSVVSKHSDNVGRGFAIVKRTDPRHPWFNPTDWTWKSYLSDGDKEQIRLKFPEANVPGVPDGPVHLWSRRNGYYTTRP